MTDDILLVTTPPSFGELIQQTLQESGRFRVDFASSAREAILQGNKRTYSLGIFDAEVRDQPLAKLVAYFKAASPQMRFIIIPPDNRPDDLEISGLPVQDFLMKPFYLPTLLETVDRVLKKDPPESTSETAEPIKSTPIPAWLQDESKLAQMLTGISLECAAQGIFVVKGEQLWAYASQLKQPAAQEIARVISNYWTSSAGKHQGKKSDLARFVRLGTDGGEYMLFATQLRGEMVLGLVFGAETPFGEIRSQTYQVARALVAREGVYREKASVSSRRVAPTLPPVKPLLENVPPPLPELAEFNGTELKESHPTTNQIEPDLFGLEIPKEPKIKPTQAPVPVDEIRQQSALPVVYDLSYFCLLLPRMPHHQLSGDLAARLSEWIGQLCMAYGWRLEHLSIHSEFMQWVVNVVPTVPVDQIMDTLRKQTSERIFASFPDLGKDNPSGDFWAPGYLVLTRFEQLSDQMIRDFTQKVRQYQGTAPAFSQRMRR